MQVMFFKFETMGIFIWRLSQISFVKYQEQHINMRHHTAVSERSDKVGEYRVIDFRCDASVSDSVIRYQYSTTFGIQSSFAPCHEAVH